MYDKTAAVHVVHCGSLIAVNYATTVCLNWGR